MVSLVPSALPYALAALLAAAPAAAEPISAPSGQRLELIEAFQDLADEFSPMLRVRLLAPEIGAARDFADVEADFLHLCRSLALPMLGPDEQNFSIVISMLDRPVSFGASDPEATQYVEAFRVENGDCVWDGP